MTILPLPGSISKKQHPRFFKHMATLEYIEAMEAKGFHFTDAQKAEAKENDENKTKDNRQ